MRVLVVVRVLIVDQRIADADWLEEAAIKAGERHGVQFDLVMAATLADATTALLKDGADAFVAFAINAQVPTDSEDEVVCSPTAFQLVEDLRMATNAPFIAISNVDAFNKQLAVHSNSAGPGPVIAINPFEEPDRFFDFIADSYLAAQSAN